MSNHKRLAAAIDLPPGYQVVRLRNSHLGVLCPDGTPLRTTKGIPIQLAYSPGNEKQKPVVNKIRKAIALREAR
jgi:hypothetical protein